MSEQGAPQHANWCESIARECNCGADDQVAAASLPESQPQKDFDALTILVARTIGGEEWKDADDSQILEEFDPWEALRKVSQPSPSGDAMEYEKEAATILRWCEGVSPTSPAAVDMLAAWLRSHDAKVSGQAEQTVAANGKVNADLFWLADDCERDCEPEEELEENFDKGQIVEFQAAARMPNFYGFWLPKPDDTDYSEFFFFNTKAEAEAALQESPSE